MRSQSLFSVIAVLIVAAVAGCAAGSLPTRSPRSQARGHHIPASPDADKPVVSLARMPAICRANSLGARFQGGGYGGGNDFGSIEIWNPGNFPCRLAGAVSFTALFADGAADLNARSSQPLPPLAVTLPAHMIRPREGADPSAYLVAALMGPERDDPEQLDGLCRPQDDLTPTTLVLSIGRVTLRIPNHDPAVPPGHGSSRAVHGCYGRVLLEAVAGPRRGPARHQIMSRETSARAAMTSGSR